MALNLRENKENCKMVMPEDTSRAYPIRAWGPLPEKLDIERGEAHLWLFSFQGRRSSIPALKETLSLEEIKRSRGFYFRKDYERFIVTHGQLRTILGRYLDEQPHRLRFSHGVHGKPALLRDPGEAVVRFNLSYSRGRVLLGVTRDMEVGVDLEYIRPDLDHEQIWERFFTSREVTVLRALPPNKQREAFFTFWTRKEALLKGTGKGLSIPLNRFDVSQDTEKPLSYVTVDGYVEGGSPWAVSDIDVGPKYRAAIAVEGLGRVVSCWKPDEKSPLIRSEGIV